MATFFGNLFKHGLNISNWTGKNGSIINRVFGGFSDKVDKLINRATAEGPTGVDEWNRANVVEDRDLQNLREDTAYQRQVADMKAAGINPAMMYGGTGAAGASSTMGAGSDAQPADFSSFLELLSMPFQIKSINAKTALDKANADRAQAEAENTRKNTAWTDKLNQARVNAYESSSGLDRARQHQIYEYIDNKMPEEINLLKKQASTEEERKLLTIAETSLKKANAEQINGLLPLQQALMSAQTDREKAQTAFAWAEYAGKKKLLDNGYWDALADNMRSQASNNEQLSRINEFIANVKTGSFEPGEDASWFEKLGYKICNTLTGALSMTGTALEGIPMPR